MWLCMVTQFLPERCQYVTFVSACIVVSILVFIKYIDACIYTKVTYSIHVMYVISMYCLCIAYCICCLCLVFVFSQNNIIMIGIKYKPNTYSSTCQQYSKYIHHFCYIHINAFYNTKYIPPEYLPIRTVIQTTILAIKSDTYKLKLQSLTSLM